MGIQRTLLLAAGAFACLTNLANAQAVEPVAISALKNVGIPDVNKMGILDGSGSTAWGVVTNTGKQTDLQALGKALFWDMQVGGDGVQACASCHFHAGTDIRKANQMSPGPAHWNDSVFDMFGTPNQTLTLNQYSPAGGPNRGLPVSQAALLTAGSVADAANGNPGTVTKAAANLDVNDVAGSQGVRSGTYLGVKDAGDNRGADYAALDSNDSRGFEVNFPSNETGVPDTTRATTARNAPSVVNAVYNLRNFWDGRADSYFNGRNPLGFRSPDARVKAVSGGAIVDQKLRIPFSSLASQAVGPIGNATEMTLGSRHVSELGKKLLRGVAIPLYGQEVKCNDSLLANYVTGCPGGTPRGLNKAYADFVKDIFVAKYWDSNQCLDKDGQSIACDAAGAYTLMEYNFPLFFGLAIQAYEASLTTEQTMADLVVGGIAKGTVTNVSKTATKTVNVTNLSLANCVLQAQFSTKAVDVDAATQLCTYHFATYIHPKAFTGAESFVATGNVASGTAIGGCATGASNTTLSATGIIQSAGTVNCAPSAAQAAARASLIAVDRGVARFFAGATGCGVCHANSEFTLASVSALTGFGAAPLPPLPTGQLRKIAPETMAERMIQFDGQIVVYDTGFYNIGVRPTVEDIAQGKALPIDPNNNIPLAYAKLMDILNGGNSADVGGSKLTADAQNKLRTELGGELTIPTSPTNLAPRQFPWRVACAPELTGQRNNKCITTVIANERLSRFGAFKTPGLRNVKFTGPYFHNGSKLNLRQVFEHYKTAGAMTTINRTNLAGGMKIFSLNVGDEAAVVEMMETGLTDWRLAWQEGKFDHPEFCIPNGHDPVTGRTILAGVEAVGSGGGKRLATFEEVIRNDDAGLASVNGNCNVPGISEVVNGKSLSTIDVPPVAQ